MASWEGSHKNRISFNHLGIVCPRVMCAGPGAPSDIRLLPHTHPISCSLHTPALSPVFFSFFLSFFFFCLGCLAINVNIFFYSVETGQKIAAGLLSHDHIIQMNTVLRHHNNCSSHSTSQFVKSVYFIINRLTSTDALSEGDLGSISRSSYTGEIRQYMLFSLHTIVGPLAHHRGFRSVQSSRNSFTIHILLSFIHNSISSSYSSVRTHLPSCHTCHPGLYPPLISACVFCGELNALDPGCKWESASTDIFYTINKKPAGT